MRIAQVQYTVKAAYAAHNKENVGRVMEELRALGRTDIAYSVCVKDDEKTFVHVLACASDAAREAFIALESFKAFQSALRESDPEAPPTTSNLTLVGSYSDLR